MLLLIDRINRSVSAARDYKVERIEWIEDIGITRLEVKAPFMPQSEAGQYFFLNIPEISSTEWHPLSVNRTPTGAIAFYVKNMETEVPAHSESFSTATLANKVFGVRRHWTALLGQLAYVCQQRKADPYVRLMGPFGHIPYKDHEHLLLFAGGIGITPMVSVFETLYHAARHNDNEKIGLNKTCVLVWVARTPQLFHLFDYLWQEVAKNDMNGRFQALLYCSRSNMRSTGTDPWESSLIRYEPLNIEKAFNELRGKGDVLAAVCGPDRLMQSVSVNAEWYHCSFHSETFYF